MGDRKRRSRIHCVLCGHLLAEHAQGRHYRGTHAERCLVCDCGHVEDRAPKGPRVSPILATLMTLAGAVAGDMGTYAARNAGRYEIAKGEDGKSRLD